MNYFDRGVTFISGQKEWVEYKVLQAIPASGTPGLPRVMRHVLHPVLNQAYVLTVSGRDYLNANAGNGVTQTRGAGSAAV